ncbi:Ribonuclease E [hydrothermal vent metagenome]|uniref:Ribonuclease G n=1 Tax=hydrothermal vent metagenome TaxID=652676 RepID=A0A1W1E3N8_9ZZZZ
MNQILINATHSEEIRVAIIKNKKLTDLNIETSLNQKHKGNIYKGKISRVEQSLEAAFVDYGKEKQGFLPFKEVSEILRENATAKGDKLAISDVLKEGQEIIVQVEKEERGNKGAALSTYINLAGAYMILTPNNAKSHGISRQITASDRSALKEIINKISLPENSGLIIRTAGSGKGLDELQWEVDYLSELWSSINIAAESRKAPFLVYQESDIVIRTLRDYLRGDTDSVIIDDLATFQNAKEFVSFVLPHYLDRVKQFDSSEHSLFNHMGIEAQVKSVFDREVSLKSGATIVFDPTEALTAIDINSARATKGSNIEDTAYNANLEAAKEIATQLQLRDIGGLVVIDFIDMTSEEHKRSIEKAMEKATSSDRARIQIGGISRFGLLEMSRQRLMSSVTESVEKTCSACDGRGTTPTVPSLALSILRQLEDGCNASSQTQRLTIQSSVDVITYLLNEKRSDIIRLENKHEIQITLLPNPYMQFPNFNINKQKGDKKPHHKSYQGISKPQNILADNGLNEAREVPAINTNHPTTRVPEHKEVKSNTNNRSKSKVSFWDAIKPFFGVNEKEEQSNKKQDNNNQNRNRNRNKSRNHNQNNNQKQQQNKQQGNKNNQKSNKNNQNKQQNQRQGQKPKPQNKPKTNNNNARVKQEKPKNDSVKLQEKTTKKPQGKPQVKPKMQQPEPKKEVKQEVKSGTKPEARTEIKIETRKERSPTVKKEMKTETKKPETKPKAKKEAKVESGNKSGNKIDTTPDADGNN